MFVFLRKTTLAHALSGATFTVNSGGLIAHYTDPEMEGKMRNFVLGTNVESQTIYPTPVQLPSGWWLVDTPGTEETRGKVN